MLELFSLGLRPALVDLSEEGDGRPTGSSGGDAPPPRTVRMYLVFEGYAEEVETQVARTRSVCRGFKGEDAGEAPSRDYWDTRHDSAYRYKERFLDRPQGAPPAEGWGGWPRRMDYFHVAIPSSRVLEYRSRCEELVSQRRLWVREYSLWTEPELFSVMLMDTSPEDQRDGVELIRTSDELLALAQDMGGSMEYVHGIGTKLAHLVERELGVGLDVLKAIKAALDPHHVMNPGNLGL
jgi:FAD/FMN-containing dehydrogenase